jgi:plastocyanin
MVMVARTRTLRSSISYSFTVTFEKPGIYDYVCTVHPWMTGSVEVT